MGRTWKPVATAILSIISGSFLLIGGIATAASPGTPIATAVTEYYMYSIGSGAPVTQSAIATVISIIAVSLIVHGIVCLLGGICALRRSVWGLALAGAIFAFFYLLPLGMPAIIFTALAKKEFV